MLRMWQAFNLPHMAMKGEKNEKHIFKKDFFF